MYENKNKQNTGTKTIKKIGKVTYEVIVHFNDNATEIMQDKLKRIMLREMESEKQQKSNKNDQKVLDKLLQELQKGTEKYVRSQKERAHLQAHQI